MAKKKITIDVDVPDGYTASKSRRSKKKTHKKAKAKIIRTPLMGKGAYDKYKNRFLEIVTRFLDEELGMIVEGIKDMVTLKKKLRTMTWHLAMLISGLTIFLYGIAVYVDCLCSALACGSAFILVGLLAIVIALIYKKMS